MAMVKNIVSPTVQKQKHRHEFLSTAGVHLKTVKIVGGSGEKHCAAVHKHKQVMKHY